MGKEEKKGFWEKVGLVVEVPDTPEGLPNGKDSTPNLFSSTKEGEVSSGKYSSPSSAEIANSIDFKHVNVVEVAYSTLPKSENDIFVVEELLKNFSALPEEQRYQTLQSTLKTMGKNIDAFITEATTRKNAILNTLSKTRDELEVKSKQIAAKIDAAKKEIESLTKENFDLKTGLDVSHRESMAECQRLDEIIKVLGGQIGGN